MKLDKFKIAIILAVAVVVFIAIMDINGIPIFGKENYTNGLFPKEFGAFFYNWAYALILFVPLAYYLFYRKDISEILAIALVSFILLFTGLADVLFFWMQGEQIPDRLPWLDKHPIIGQISGGEVTSRSLLFSALLGGIASFFTAKYLKEKF